MILFRQASQRVTTDVGVNSGFVDREIRFFLNRDGWVHNKILLDNDLPFGKLIIKHEGESAIGNKYSILTLEKRHCLSRRIDVPSVLPVK